MKTFKLIKKYPGSPNLGTLLTSNINHQIVYHISGRPFIISEEELEYQTEFWEEIVKKDYKILKIQTNIEGRISNFSEESQEDYINVTLKCKGTSIHSIKRLSDGEVFTVGDKIIHNNNVSYPEGIITKLDIISNTIFVETNNRVKGFHTNICLVSKKKKPLFTTEDGVDVFLPEQIVHVPKYDFTSINSVEAGRVYEEFQEENSKNRYVVFYSKERAKEYNLMTKPCLSITDIEIMRERHPRSFKSLIINLSKVVEARINNAK